MKNQHKKGDKHTYIRCAFYNRRDAQRINGQKIQTLIIVYDKMKTAKLLRPAEFVVILAIGIAEGEKKTSLRTDKRLLQKGKAPCF